MPGGVVLHASRRPGCAQEGPRGRGDGPGGHGGHRDQGRGHRCGGREGGGTGLPVVFMDNVPVEVSPEGVLREESGALEDLAGNWLHWPERGSSSVRDVRVDPCNRETRTRPGEARRPPIQLVNEDTKSRSPRACSRRPDLDGTAAAAGVRSGARCGVETLAVGFARGKGGGASPAGGDGAGREWEHLYLQRYRVWNRMAAEDKPVIVLIGAPRAWERAPSRRTWRSGSGS